MRMKLYVVTADTYIKDDLGSEIYIFGVYTEKEKAERRKESLEMNFGYFCSVTEVLNNEDIEEYLGGYIE